MKELRWLLHFDDDPSVSDNKPSLLIFQLRKSRFSFVARRETRSLAVHEWNSRKSWFTIWIFISYEDWWKTHSCFSIFLRSFLKGFWCGPYEQFSLGCKEKSQISDWDFYYHPIFIKLNEGFWKYLRRSIFSSLGKKSFRFCLRDKNWAMIVKLSDWEKRHWECWILSYISRRRNHTMNASIQSMTCF